MPAISAVSKLPKLVETLGELKQVEKSLDMLKEPGYARYAADVTRARARLERVVESPTKYKEKTHNQVYSEAYKTLTRKNIPAVGAVAHQYDTFIKGHHSPSINAEILVELYAGSGANVANTYLLGRLAPSEQLGTIAKYTRDLIALVRQHKLEQPLEVFRGFTNKTMVEHPDRFVGREYTAPTFMSTSKQEAVARSFASPESTAEAARVDGAMFRIQLPKGSYALDTLASGFERAVIKMEREVILPPQTKYKILGYTKDPDSGITIFDVEVVPDAASP